MRVRVIPHSHAIIPLYGFRVKIILSPRSKALHKYYTRIHPRRYRPVAASRNSTFKIQPLIINHSNSVTLRLMFEKKEK